VRIRRRLPFIFLGVIAIGTSGLALRPDGRTPSGHAARPLLEGARIDPATLAILQRACQNCHSERTEWPWYSHLPPASWLIHRDVDEARAQLNLSRWQDRNAAEQKALLSEIGAAARSGSMPPAQYRWLHPASKLSPEEREQVYRWTRAERSRVAGPRSGQDKPQQVSDAGAGGVGGDAKLLGGLALAVHPERRKAE
jgi:hypothetical protein